MPNPLDPPASLDAARRAIWLDTVQQIMAAGTLERVDPNGLLAYTEAVWRQRRAQELAQQSDVLTVTKGRAVANPAIQVLDQAARTIAQFGRQYRLTAPRGTDQLPAAEAVQGGNPTQPADLPRWCDEHNRSECTKQRSKGRGVCHGPVVKGTTACRMHAGRSKAVALAHKLDLQVPTYGAPIVIRAERAVLEELWRTAGHVAWLGKRVGDMEAELLTYGTISRTTRNWGEYPGSEELAKAGPHVLLDLYYRERRHLVDVAMGILQHGLAQRMVDDARERGSRMASVIDGILHDLTLNEDQWALVPEVVPRRLLELPA